jgi:mono/diheme cytochrome c family protein/glucose/arabinose dehydrogenase
MLRFALPGLFTLCTTAFSQTADTVPSILEVREGSRIAMVGGGLASRMNIFGYFEAELQCRYPDLNLVIRNFADEGDTPGIRPHPGRRDRQAFPGANQLAFGEFKNSPAGVGHFASPDEWLTREKSDLVLAFFGLNCAFNGPEGLEAFKGELNGFLKHTLKQPYNGDSPPGVALISPLSAEDVSHRHDLPNGADVNANLSLYTEAMREVAAENGVRFVDLFHPSKKWMASKRKDLTRDGVLLNEDGYRKLGPFLADQLFGKSRRKSSRFKKVRAAVLEKNWCWLNEYKVPNGVHVYGRRYKPYGPHNYPDELKKTREMTEVRDRAIWAAAKKEPFDLAAEDEQTHPLSPVQTNYRPSGKKTGATNYVAGTESKTRITPADGYQVELFASEREFTNLANPVQMAFDNRGRLWVSTMPSYPHYRIGDPKPDDKIIILEDTDGDGRADREKVFADKLHMPTGFEITAQGVFVSQSHNLLLLKDTNGDDVADVRDVVMSGFDDHDTHHAFGAFSADPMGGIFMSEGIFLHSHLETAYGPVRAYNGGFFRYDPVRHRMERYAALHTPNPWGNAVDRYGMTFFLNGSTPKLSWMDGSAAKPRYGFSLEITELLTNHKVRPTCGLEFVSSRHFPDDVQGDAILCNVIGYRGAKQHQIMDDAPGFKATHRQDLFKSSDPNFRPCDLEFAPDGSLYFVDWHNILIGHAQHSARDPLRDHVHGRVYRVTYPDRPLVEPADIHGARISTLLENLKLPEDRSRYRTRRELWGRKRDSVLKAIEQWVSKLEGETEVVEHAKLEALWVTAGFNRVHPDLLRELLSSEDARIRAAAVQVLRFHLDAVPDQHDLLMKAAKDANLRVRLLTINAASHLPAQTGRPIVEAARPDVKDPFIEQAISLALAQFDGVNPKLPEPGAVESHFKGANLEVFEKGAEVYKREGHCATCHQPDGKGLPESGFPPINNTPWINGDLDQLIKITLNGLMGPITVHEKKYEGHVPMPGFGALLSDEEIAAVLTYVKNRFGHKSPVVKQDQVKKVREATAEKVGFYTIEELEGRIPEPPPVQDPEAPPVQDP